MKCLTMTCLVMMFFSNLTASTTMADTITVCADKWCPYNCDPGSNDPGYMIEIATLIFAKAGHTLDYQTKPWTRAIDETRKGLFNAIVGAVAGDAPDFVYPQEEQGIINNVFWVRKGYNWRFDSIESLRKVRLGVIQDYDYGKEITEYIKKNKGSQQVQVLSSDTALEQNIKKLLANRLDVIIEDDNVFRYKLAEIGKESKVVRAAINKEHSGEEKLYIAFSPANPKSKEYADLLSQGMKQLRSSGELSTLLAKYGLTDWVNTAEK